MLFLEVVPVLKNSLLWLDFVKPLSFFLPNRGIRLPLDRGIANIPYKSNSKPDARFLLFSES